MDFNKETIKDGFDIGIDFANTFFETYIKDFNDDLIKSIVKDTNYNPFDKYYN